MILKSARCVGVAALWLIGFCGGCRLENAQRLPPTQWKTGYWFWHNYESKVPIAADTQVDSLYVHVPFPGYDLRHSWPLFLPRAHEYWVAYRIDERRAPEDRQVSWILESFGSIKRITTDEGQTLVGLQLDYDCPTDSLKNYAGLLKKLRRSLPTETRISITALLDWFRPGTDISSVLAEVNEYVPQFYDVAPPSYRQVGLKIDSNKWSPVFNSYRIPYRIGIATFGRISSSAKGQKVKYIRHSSAFELALDPTLDFAGKRVTSAGEIQVEYRSMRSAEDPYKAVLGDHFEVVLPTAESIRSAVEASHALGGYCTGVVFFRWPVPGEDLVLSPEEVKAVLSGEDIMARGDALEVKNGYCAAVFCADLYLQSGGRYSEQPLSFRIRSSQPLEYVLPAANLDMKVAGPSEILLNLPAFFASRSLHLGRAVTNKSGDFMVERLP